MEGLPSESADSQEEVSLGSPGVPCSLGTSVSCLLSPPPCCTEPRENSPPEAIILPKILGTPGYLRKILENSWERRIHVTDSQHGGKPHEMPILDAL